MLSERENTCLRKWHLVYLRTFLVFAVISTLSTFSSEAQDPAAQINALFENGQDEQGDRLLDSLLESSLSNQQVNFFQALSLIKGNRMIRSGEYSSASAIFEKAVDPDLIGRAVATETLGDLYHKRGVAQYLDKKYEKAIHSYQKAVNVRSALFGSDNLDVARSYHNIGTCYEKMNDPDKAINFFQKGAEIRKKHDVPDDLAYSYLRLGVNYVNKEDYDKGLSYYEPALAIYRNLYGDIDYDVAELYNVIGIAQFLKKDYPKAISAYEEALKIYSHPQIKDLEGQTNCLNNLGGAYFESGKVARALGYYEKSLALNRKLASENLDGLADNYTNIGLCYNRLKQFEKAKDYLERALNTSVTIFGPNHPENAYHYDNLATLFFDSGDPAEAILQNGKGLQKLIADYSLNGKIMIRREKITGSKRLLLTMLKSRAKYLQAADKISVDLIENAYIASDQLIDLMRQDHEAVGSKLFWTEEALPLYEDAMAFTLKFKQEKEAKDMAFYFMEKSKSILLLDALKESEARTFAGIKPETLEQEVALKQSISDLEQKLYAAHIQSSPDSVAISSLQQQLIQKEQAYSSLIKELERTHPEYYQIKYQRTPLKREELNDLIGKNSGLIEFFVGTRNLYTYYHFGEKQGFLIAPLPENLEEDVASLRESIYGYFTDQNRSDSLFAALSGRYTSIAHKLYGRLMAPLEEIGIPERLLIIPDGVLGYLPFDALLKTFPEEAQKFKSHQYLLREHQISYSYSAALFKVMTGPFHRAKARKGLLAFAPSFAEASQEPSEYTRSGLRPLLNNKNEVHNIQRIMGGQVLLDEEATEEKFRQLAGQYRILHFATHGQANDQNSDFSFLAFTPVPDSSENEFLFVHDLYNFQLSAELAVLSACETGVGKLYRGEGIISLARGFSYAGVQSVVTTLWSVNDAKTSDIMTSFYRELKKRSAKDLALQQAKLDYLETADHFNAHPYFWAGAIAIGNMEPLTSTPALFNPWFIALVGALGILLFLGWRRFK